MSVSMTVENRNYYQTEFAFALEDDNTVQLDQLVVAQRLCQFREHLHLRPSKQHWG